MQLFSLLKLAAKHQPARLNLSQQGITPGAIIWQITTYI